MISRPSRWEAASTRSASCAGCNRASFGCGTRSRTVGTCPVNGSTLAQSRNSSAATDSPKRRGTTRRAIPRRPVSTPTTRYHPSTRAISMSLARTRRAPSTLISCRSSTSFFSRTSCGRRSNGRRSSFAAPSCTWSWRISATTSAGTNTSRPATLASTPLTSGYSSPSRTITSATRPSVPPASSRRSPPTISDRCRIGRAADSPTPEPYRPPGWERRPSGQPLMRLWPAMMSALIAVKMPVSEVAFGFE